GYSQWPSSRHAAAAYIQRMHPTLASHANYIKLLTVRVITRIRRQHTTTQTALMGCRAKHSPPSPPPPNNNNNGNHNHTESGSRIKPVISHLLLDNLIRI